MSRSAKIMDIVTILIGACGVALIAVSVAGRRVGPSDVPQYRSVANWESMAKDGHRAGPSVAPVTVVVWQDYQCPACRAFDSTLRSITKAYKSDIAVVYRHWPLEVHEHAYSAARAAECASDQGRFLEFNDALYTEWDTNDADWLRVANWAGIRDTIAFAACVAQTSPVPTIERDIQAAKMVGGRGTPTILVNDRLLRGAPDSAGLDQLVKNAR